VFVGVDGGGTHARALVTDEHGAELARVAGPAGIIDAAEPGRGAAVIAGLVLNALDAAGLEAPCTALCCGLAGAGRESERQAVTTALRHADVAHSVMVLGDADVAMADAFGDASGALLIAGTGSIAWARSAGQAPVRAGGWGRLFGDEGSAYRIGLDALRQVARADDGRSPASTLTAAILAASGCDEPADLIRFADRATKATIAGLAPHVLACVGHGDAAADAIRDEAVAALIELVVTAVRRAGIHAPHVALAGGLLDTGDGLRMPLEAALRRALPDSTVRTEPVDAARGAARLARGMVAGS
jgi:N-acetylglucosamine kinase-like BadF-type ATPase